MEVFVLPAIHEQIRLLRPMRSTQNTGLVLFEQQLTCVMCKTKVAVAMAEQAKVQFLSHPQKD